MQVLGSLSNIGGLRIENAVVVRQISSGVSAHKNEYEI